MKPLLTATAIVEAGAGLALLGIPSLTASLLLGAPLESSAAATLARVGGAAILALALVCWLTRDVRNPVSRGLVIAMTFYNIAVAAVYSSLRTSDKGCTACCCGQRYCFMWR